METGPCRLGALTAAKCANSYFTRPLFPESKPFLFCASNPAVYIVVKVIYNFSAHEVCAPKTD